MTATKICCVMCCDSTGKHTLLLTDSEKCLWCPRCKHVYSGRCEMHLEGAQ